MRNRWYFQKWFQVRSHEGVGASVQNAAASQAIQVSDAGLRMAEDIGSRGFSGLLNVLTWF